MHNLRLTQPLSLFFFLQSVKSSRTVWVLFPSFCVQPHHSPGAGAERLRGKGPMESRFSKKCGITGASWWGDGERNCARCVDRVGGRGGERMGWEALEKREGRGHLNYLCSLWPRSPSVSLWTDPLSERRGAFPQADAHPPPLFEIAFAPSAELQKLNCNNLFSNAFLLYLSLSKISILPLKKKRKIKAFFEGGGKSLFPGTWPDSIRLKMYNKIKGTFIRSEQFPHTYSAGYMQLS